jgi:type VI secretion system protein ImpH
VVPASRPEDPDLSGAGPQAPGDPPEPGNGSHREAAASTTPGPWPIAAALDKEPYSFEFFQAVRLLALMHPERQVVGRFTRPEDEVVHFGVNPAVWFPPSQLHSLDMPEDGPAFMRVNFMGLTGPLGVLPLTYSQLVLERLRERDRTMQDFFDIFNHRMISLFWQAWEKYRFSIPYERGENDRFSYRVLALLGLGTPGLQDRQDVPDDSLLFYSGLLSLHTHSATGLRQLLADYFEVPVEVEQFVGAWYPVDRESQYSLGESNRDEEKLGFGCVVGDEVWDQQSRVRIRLGPLTLEQYVDFLPGGSAWRHVRSLTRFFAGSEFDMELQLVLRRDEAPPCELQAVAETAPRLGWTSWIKNTPFTRDPGETVLEL